MSWWWVVATSTLSAQQTISPLPEKLFALLHMQNMPAAKALIKLWHVPAWVLVLHLSDASEMTVPAQCCENYSSPKVSIQRN
jgi:hypothetical protein